MIRLICFECGKRVEVEDWVGSVVNCSDHSGGEEE